MWHEGVFLPSASFVGASWCRDDRAAPPSYFKISVPVCSVRANVEMRYDVDLRRNLS